MRVRILLIILCANVTEYSSPASATLSESVYTESTVRIIPADAVIPIAEGDTLSLKCLIGGHPRAKPKWLVPKYYAGRNLNTDEAELSITNIRRHEQGSITCSANNGHGRPQFATTIIHVYFLMPPSLRLYKAKSTVRQDSIWFSRTVILLCQTFSYPKPHVTWYWRGREISSATANAESNGLSMIWLESSRERSSSHVLKIRNVSPRHYGDYACKASLSVGRTYGIPDTAANITLTDKIAEPVIRIRSNDVIVVNPGSDISLVCEATGGFPLPKMSWANEDETVSQSKRCSALPDRIVLSLGPVRLTQAGVYRCIADNSIQKVVVRQVKIVVRYIKPMHLWITPDALSDDGKLEVGKEITLTCYVDAQPIEELRYIWYKQVGKDLARIRRDTTIGNVIEKITKVDVTKTVTLPAHSSVLEIRAATEDDYGTYVCNATLVNSSFETAVTASVSITRDSAPSQMTTPNALVYAVEGHDATLKCKATGQPQAKIKWFRDGNKTVPSERIKIFEDGTLTISDVSRYDQATYTCKPSFENGFSQLAKQNSQAEVELRVKCLPDASPTYQLHRVAIGSQLELQCTSSTDSDGRIPRYQWFREGRDDPIATISKIRLEKITDSQYGIYYCHVVNAVGESRCVFNVTAVAYAPEFYYEEDTIVKRRATPTNSPASTTNAAYRLKWTQPNPIAVGKIWQYRIRWKRLGSFQLASSSAWREAMMPVTEEITVGKLLSYNITDLVPGRYEVEVTPKNAFGYGESARRILIPKDQSYSDSSKPFLGDRLECTFTSGDMCDFLQEQNGNTEILYLMKADDFDWTMNSAQKLLRRTVGTGPSQDHTTGDRKGGYMYIESSNAKKNSIARLASPVLWNKKDVSSCLTFYYHMWGRHTGTLNVIIRAAGDEVVWSNTGQQENKWKKGVVTIQQRLYYRVVFEAVMINSTGSLYLGDIAIDDISITIGSCPPLPTTATADIFSTSSGTPQSHQSFLNVLHKHCIFHHYFNFNFLNFLIFVYIFCVISYFDILTLYPYFL